MGENSASGPIVSTAPRRIPQGAELEPLLLCYGYRLTRAGTVKGTEPSHAPEDIAAAEGFGWPVRSTERWTPQEIVERATVAADALDVDAVLGAFVAGLGSAPRGRQTAISFGWARHLGTGRRGDRGVPDCGLTEDSYAVDVTERLVRLSPRMGVERTASALSSRSRSRCRRMSFARTGDDRQRLRVTVGPRPHAARGTPYERTRKGRRRSKIVPGPTKYQRYRILIGDCRRSESYPACALVPSWDRFVPKPNAGRRIAASRAGRDRTSRFPWPPGAVASTKPEPSSC